MEKEVTLGEIFAKSNVNNDFDAENFANDVENLTKAETEQLLGQIQSEIIKGGDYEVLSSMRTIALNHIEKARSGVYADTAQNRKLGRVGQQYGGKKQEADKGGRGFAKVTADDAAEFLSKHAEEYMDYQYGNLNDSKLEKKFDAAAKYIKEFKTFDWSAEDEADEYKTKMEKKGYKVINVGEGSDTIAYAVIKSAKRK